MLVPKLALRNTAAVPRTKGLRFSVLPSLSPFSRCKGAAVHRSKSLRLWLRISPSGCIRLTSRHICVGLFRPWRPDCGISTHPVPPGNFRTTRTSPDQAEFIQVMSDVRHVASQLAYMPHLLCNPVPVGGNLMTPFLQVKVWAAAAATHPWNPPSRHLLVCYRVSISTQTCARGKT